MELTSFRLADVDVLKVCVATHVIPFAIAGIHFHTFFIRAVGLVHVPELDPVKGGAVRPEIRTLKEKPKFRNKRPITHYAKFYKFRFLASYELIIEKMMQRPENWCCVQYALGLLQTIHFAQIFGNVNTIVWSKKTCTQSFS